MTYWQDDNWGAFFMGVRHANLLPRLLLAFDDTSICGRRDESRFDCRAQCVRAGGENHPKGILAGQGRRFPPHGLGGLAGVFGKA